MQPTLSGRPRVPRRFQTPLIYEIGKDITQEKYDEILVAIIDWMREQRPNEKEPATVAQLRIQECLEGKKKDGTPWYDADTTSLAARIRSKLRYDIEKMQPLRNAPEKNRKKKAKEKELLQLKSMAKRNDPLLPKALQDKLKQNFTYGDDPNVFKTSAELVKWKQIREAYIEEFPELSTINAKAELDVLCDSHIEFDRYRAKREAQEKYDLEIEAATTKRFVDMKKALGIHPDQLARRTKTKTAFSVGEAVMRLESMGDTWIEIRDVEIMEEFLQIYKRYCTPNADGTGWQLDELALFGLTRCRPIPCPSCGTVHVFGVPIQMVEEWLEGRDVLVEEVDNESIDESNENVSELAQVEGTDSGAKN